MKIAGYILTMLGLAMTIFTTITYFTSEKLVTIGLTEIRATKPHSLTWTPFIGLAIMVVGVFIILQSRKKQ